MVSLVVFRRPYAVASEIREWRLLMLVLGGATLLFGITLYKILFSGAVPIAPESAPDPDARSLRNWSPGHVAAGGVFGGAIAVLIQPLCQIGSRSMYAELVRVAGAIVSSWTTSL